jgi:conjugative transposon TraM protein
MQKVQRTQAFLRRRKMLLVIPLLIIPFLTMAFWALGGGKMSQVDLKTEKLMGLNLNLPNPQLKDDKLHDKLSFYDKADKDSLKIEEYMRSDPYYKKMTPESLVSTDLENITQATASKYKQNLNQSVYPKSKKDPADEIMERVNKIQVELNKPETHSNASEKIGSEKKPTDENQFPKEIDRLEKMMQIINNPDSQDNELGKVEGVLDKILDAQHPERVKERLSTSVSSKKTMLLPVVRTQRMTSVSLLDTGKENSVESGFFGVDKENESKEENSIRAVVHQNQTLTNGSIIKLRLLDGISVGSNAIPAGTFLYGIAALNGERLQIEINSVRTNNSVYAVKLRVYDIDGLPGIDIPGAIGRDVVKQSTDNTLQSMELTTYDPSLKAQAAAAGVNTAKNLISKKVKLVRVTVKAGYNVLLKDRNSDQD